MKRNSKKVLAILLALVMILGQIPVLSSAAEGGEYAILHQPTYAQPYIEVAGSPTGYQWCYDTEVVVDTPAVGEVTGDKQVLVTAIHGSWDVENGVYKSASWEEGQHLLTLEFADLEEGEWIFIPEFHGYIEDVFMTTSDCYDKGDGYYIDIGNYEDPTVIVLSIDPAEDNDLGEFSVAPVVCHHEKQTVTLEGQNKAEFKLTKPMDQNVYCVATYQDGTSVTSDSFYLGIHCYSEPTWKNPTALFTWDQYITGYQWYRYEATDNMPLLNAVDSGILNFNDGIFNISGNQFASTEYYDTNMINFGVAGGLKYTIRLPEGFEGSVSGGDDVGTEITPENGVITLEPSDPDTYQYILITSDSPFSVDADVVLQDKYDVPVAVEGETSKTLNAADLGIYRCRASYKIENNEFYCDVDLFMQLEITKQPTQENPTVDVNFPNKTKFQWYALEIQNKTFPVTPDFVEYYECDFNEETNQWRCYEQHGYANLRLEARAGASVKITVTSENFAGEVYANGEPMTGENGVYTYTCEERTGLEIAIRDESDFAFTVEYSGEAEVPVAVEGQVSATLTAPKPGRYFCKVSGSDDYVQETERFELYYEVTQQPTEEKPEISVNFADQIKGYQWYTVVEDTFTGYPTQEQIEDMMDYCGDIQTDGSWKSVEMEPFKHVIMIMMGEATVKLDIPEGATVTGGYKKLEDGSYTAKEENGLFLIIHDEEPFTVKPLVTVNIRDDVAVEGQTSATYAGPKTGSYYCVVEYKDGEEVRSDYVSYEPYIEKHPNTDEPTVKVTDAELVKSYQWFTYKQAKKSDTLKPEHVYRSYNLYKNNKWQSVELEEGVHGIRIDLMVVAGDKLTLELPEGIDFQVEVDGGSYSDGVITADGYMTSVYVIAEQSFEMAAKLDYTDYSFEPVADQTTDTLTTKGPGYYYCLVTYQDGTELKSRTLDYSQRIENQPTGEAPVVEMLWPELVEKYQWYKVTYSVKNVTHAADSFEAEAMEAIYADGIWYVPEGNGYTYFVRFQVKPGMVVRVTTVGTTELDYMEQMELVEPGVYECEITWSGTFEICGQYLHPATAEDGIKIQVTTPTWEEAVSGQTGNIFTGSAGDYLCVITDKDGVEYTTDIISVSDYYLTKLPEKDDFTVQVNDPDSVESYQWYVLEEVLATRPAVPINPADDEVEAFYSDDVIFHNNKWYAPHGEVGYFGFDVSVGDEIIITPDASFTGELGLQMRASFAEIQQKDGSYIITVKEDIGRVVVYMYNHQENFTFTAAVKGTKMVAKAVEGAVSASFNAQETGEYFCVVTMKDGTKLTSTTVKYEKPAEPPVADDPIPPTGEGMTVAMLVAVAALAMAAVLALGFDTKREF